ncbi:MAG: hypothetical protein GTN93_07615, partial [Anaerolineae bacterium]|nr:hypothetical protein [Anaerolineae bacterium]
DDRESIPAVSDFLVSVDGNQWERATAAGRSDRQHFYVLVEAAGLHKLDVLLNDAKIGRWLESDNSHSDPNARFEFATLRVEGRDWFRGSRLTELEDAYIRSAGEPAPGTPVQGIDQLLQAGLAEVCVPVELSVHREWIIRLEKGGNHAEVVVAGSEVYNLHHNYDFADGTVATKTAWFQTGSQPVNSDPGLAILIAGTDQEAQLFDYLSMEASFIYQQLITLDFTDEQIWYAKEGGDPCSDSGSTRTSVEAAFEWACHNVAEGNHPVFVFMVGHG